VKIWLTPVAAEDVAYWRSANPAMACRIEHILQQLTHAASLPRHQITPLALSFPPLLSVKISPEHRVVFERLRDAIVVHQCRYHY
jgi:toxin YoeB